MSQLVLFLNELSVSPVALSRPEAQGLVRELVDALRGARANKGALSLNAIGRLSDHLVDTEKTVQQVLGGNDFREEWGFLRRLADRSPLADDLVDLKALDDIDYRCDGKRAIALGCAHLLDTAAVSFPSDDKWREANIRLVRQELVASGDLIETEAHARNIGLRAHAETWREWLVTYGNEEVPRADECWSARHERFPNLRFLDRVEDDLYWLGDGGPAYKQAIGALDELNRDLAGWDATGAPLFSRKVTPEAEGRRRLCWSIDADGEEYCFDLHARFTGGIPGRIHFRLAGAERKAVIAYIGMKLDSSLG